jgi:3-hydroxy-9,10-secoandrosta-1,3,5(10)-triene-9,17-dione monooxygenase reductase component
MTLELRRAFGHFATGVTVVTTTTVGGVRAGITVNSFSSVSLEPPLLLWAIARTANTFEAFRSCTGFAVHVLHAGQAPLAVRFASTSPDRFADIATATSGSGAPLLPDFLARFDCASDGVHDGGDHLILVGRVLAYETRAGDPLVFYRGRFHESLGGAHGAYGG